MVEKTQRLIELTAQIVAAHVAHNRIDTHALPELIRQVHASLSALDGVAPRNEQLVPAVSVKKSVAPDYLICLEDGKKLKMLKRHLATVFNLTPEQYRQRWGLPPNYPMVAPNYAARRRELAKEIGLGTTRGRKSR
jgi:predicted transcriptional regulator